MERLQMCRMCLVEDATMYVVVNKNLHELYEKLTGKPFVTEDRRPVLVCYFCCSKLKQCRRFQRKCLEAEELFAQMLDANNVPNPLISPKMLAFNNGFVISPMEYLDITVGECQTESHAVKEELPDCETLADIIEPKEELQVDELKNPDSSDGVSITEVITEVEGEQDTNCAPIAKKPNLRLKRTKLEDVITEEQKKNELSDLKVIWTTQNRTSQTVSKLNPFICTNRLNNIFDSSRSVNNKNVNTNFCNDGNKNDMRFKITNTEKDSDNVNRHGKLCVKDRPYKCKVCPFSCKQKCKLTEHVRIHAGEKPYKCEICQYCSNRKSNLIQHNRIHTSETPYKCQMCQYSCKQKSLLKKHVRIHSDEKPYQCEVCQRSFRLKHNLTTHIRIHTGEKPYKCQICQYSCNHKSRLTDHVRIHTGEKPYQCDVCQRSFRIKHDLTTHIQIHFSEKPYKCQLCQYSCNHKSNLTKHVRIHTGGKPYQCEVCQRSFRLKHYLTKHVSIHTGEKPYQCEVCQHSFRQKHALTKHIRIHMGEKP